MRSLILSLAVGTFVFAGGSSALADDGDRWDRDSWSYRDRVRNSSQYWHDYHDRFDRRATPHAWYYDRTPNRYYRSPYRYYRSPYTRYYGSPYRYYRSPSYYRGYSSWGYPYSSYSYPFRGYSFHFSF